MRILALAALVALSGIALAAPHAAALAAPTTLVAVEGAQCGGGAKVYCFDQSNITVGGGELPFALRNPAENKAPHNLCIRVGTTTSCTPGPGNYSNPGNTSDFITVTINQAGTYDYWCEFPGHKDLGMFGTIYRAPDPKNGTGGSGSGSGSGSGTGGKSTPGLELAPMLGALALVALAQRRRSA